MSTVAGGARPADGPVLRLRGVHFDYDGIPVLRAVDLTVHRGEFLAVIGPNGGGKSTLLRLILGLLEPRRGTIEVLGVQPRQARRAIGYCPQSAGFRRSFPQQVVDVVLQGRLGLPGTRWRYRRIDHAVVDDALARVGIRELAWRPLTALSGGQLQRVLVARALVSEPRLLLLDEPSAHLDERGGNDLYELLARLTPELTVMVVTHDLGFVSDRVSRVACVNREVWCHHPREIDGRVIDAMYQHHVRGIDHDHRHHHDHPVAPPADGLSGAQAPDDHQST